MEIMPIVGARLMPENTAKRPRATSIAPREDIRGINAKLTATPIRLREIKVGSPKRFTRRPTKPPCTMAAMNPQYVRAEDVPAEFVAKEKEIALGQMTEKDKAKPAEILEKIVSGKINKIVSEVTLLGQPYVLDTNVSVGDALKKDGAEVVSVVRLAVGEGIEKVEEDFAAEVMKQAGLA